MNITVDPHPLLVARAFVTEFPRSIEQMKVDQAVLDLLDGGGQPQFERDEEHRLATRDLLRHGGYKPTGRGKPASEYLIKAAEEGGIGSINLPVDVCNAVSLHSGIPISVVDLDRATAPFRIGLADQGSSYVFNRTGQEIDLSGLLCLFDADGPCANAVRDSQRTKTSPSTVRTLSVCWGAKGWEERTDELVGWYRGLLEASGAATLDATLA